MTQQLQQQKQKIIAQLEHCDRQIVQNHIDILVKSDFLVEIFASFPEWLTEIATNPPDNSQSEQYHTQLAAQLNCVVDESQLMKILRQFRNRMLARINWGQISKSCETKQTLQQLSQLAECLIIGARDWLYQASCQEFGTPKNKQGDAQPLLILGMGKLGGGELNFSSDIDLIFTYPEHGSTQGGRRELDNAVFFTRLGQRLIKVLDQMTQDGFVYRVDMRLRPLGDGGPLVLSFAAMEDYYQEQGRDWERYAMVKAKILGEQNHHYVQTLYQMLRPFIYRRYIDFSVLQSLRNMKAMIEREVRRRGLTNNIKLGAGGIREVEFIVQVFQLIRGGRVTSLQTRSLLEALTIIEQEKLLPSLDVATLHDNYLFLRRCENLLQGINDEQTQTLPDDKLNQARLADGMGFDSWEHFTTELNNKMQASRVIFNALIGENESDKKSHEPLHFAELWQADIELSDIQNLLPALKDEEEQQLYQMLTQFRHDLSKRTIGIRGREILDQLMPRVLSLILSDKKRLVILPRVLHLLINIVSRTTYLELFIEYPDALKQLIRLCAASLMINEQLTRHPVLLDELIDYNSLCQILNFDSYKSELYQYLLRIPTDEEEQQLEALRQFKQMQLLHIAAADIESILPTMKVSDHLTFLAEAMIDFVVQLAWNQMIERYGRPNHLEEEHNKGLVVIGYGKLGGLELGYSSDLDLVFLHDCPIDSVTTGEKSIDSRQFYLRLVQRVIHLFSVRTNSGILYEVDVRLRPQGNAGLLACSLKAFEDYQYKEAWTWEHQALVRARAVYGDDTLKQRFNQIRRNVLSQKRDEPTLRNDVKSMREKMREHLGNKSTDKFNIKIDAGGIGDIEFISQFLVLNFAHQYPKMVNWSDNVRIFESAANYDIMTEEEAHQLIQYYLQMRDEIHRLSLQQLSAEVECADLLEARKFVKQSWNKWLKI